MQDTSFELPALYYLVHAANVVFRVSPVVAQDLKAFMRQHEGRADAFNYAFDFEDIFGADCTVYCGAVNVIYSSTETLRAADREHQRLIDQESQYD